MATTNAAAVTCDTTPTSKAAITIATTAAAVRTRLSKYYEGFAAHANVLSLAGQFFDSQVSRIKAKLYPGAREEELLAAAVGAKKEFIPVRNTVVVLGERLVSGSRAALAKSQPAENELVRFWRHQELRDEVRELGPLLRIAFVEQAGRNGDADSIEAVANAPKGFGLVKQDVLDKARATAAGKLNPELADIAALKQAYEAILAAAEKGIADTLAAEGIGPANVDPGTMITV